MQKQRRHESAIWDEHRHRGMVPTSKAQARLWAKIAALARAQRLIVVKR